MSQLRAPAARPDRREGGRHGRPGARPHAQNPARQGGPSQARPPETRIRPLLLRAALLPSIVAALSGAAAVLYLVHAARIHPTTEVWTVIGVLALLALSAVVAAGIGAERAAVSVLVRCHALRRNSARSQAELQRVVEQLRHGEGPPVRRTPEPALHLAHGGDEFDLLGQELGRSHEAAVAAVVQASRLSSSVGNEQKVEVFVNLARRLQSLVHREIQLLDDLENEVEDPELLKGLFHVDHLATRIRRHAENLAVLGGAISRRQWSNPVSMTEVMRSAIAEVEQYPRVKLVPPIDGTLRGHAVADVIHLLAELVENATVFSAPHTQVLLRAQYVTAGLAVEVEDRGLGMPGPEQERMNALLADPDQVNVAHLLQDGRIGLYVVAALARRHGIAVRLQSNIYGGVGAVLVLPQTLLGENEGEDDAAAARARDAARDETGPPELTPATAPVVPRPAAPPAPQAPEHTEQPRPAQPHTPVVPHGATDVPGTIYAPPATTAPEPSGSTTGNIPLPVRGEQRDRPNPAAAVPGVNHPSLRPESSANGATRSPLDSMVRGTMSRPQLPKRRSQEHLVAELREGPVVRVEDEYALHDPGLMAAFQRGISLAESAPQRDRREDPLEHGQEYRSYGTSYSDPYAGSYAPSHVQSYNEPHVQPYSEPSAQPPAPEDITSKE
ncbi:sensor histidine kinase [Streptomyces sp. NPDC050504]|uniref:sensor histidine kinase n=1 Tax=Streptomyces sp. NPDC050504 TaxID=3365618 RepID=UPI0037A3AC20